MRRPSADRSFSSSSRAAFLFAFIGISASDFFCPNLATVADRLGMGESTAGVTFLAFGNGSPDVFSTFSALRSNTFSLAIGELLGASAFIISIVVGSMSLVQPFHVPRWPFCRDVGFFTLAVCVLVGCLADGELSLVEAGSMVGMYVAYVGIVVGGNWLARRRERRRGGSVHDEDDYKPLEQEEQDEILPSAAADEEDATPAYLLPLDPGDRTRSRSSSISSGTSSQHRQLSASLNPSRKPSLRARRSSSAMRTAGPHIFTHRNSSAAGADTPRPTFSLLGAVEFRDIVNSLRKESGVLSPVVGDGVGGGVLASLAVTPGDQSNMNDPAAGYFGQLSPFSRGHYHAPHHAGRHSVGGGEAGLLSPLGGPETRTRRSASQAPTPLRNDPGVGGPPVEEPSRPMALSRTISMPGPSREEHRSWPAGTATRRPTVDAIAEAGEDSLAISPVTQSSQFLNTASGNRSESTAQQQSLSPVDNPWQDVPSHRSARIRPQIDIPPTSARLGERQPPGGHRTVPSISVTEPDFHTEEIAFDPTAHVPGSRRQRIRHILHATYHLLFPSLHDFRQKSRVGQVLALFAIPAIFCLTITLPVVDDAGEEGALNRGGVALPQVEEEEHSPSPYHDADAEGNYMDDAEVEDRRKVSGRAGHMLHHLVDGYPMSPGSPHISPKPVSRAGSLVPSELPGGEQDSITDSDSEQLFLFNKYLAGVQCVLGPLWFTTVCLCECIPICSDSVPAYLDEHLKRTRIGANGYKSAQWPADSLPLPSQSSGARTASTPFGGSSGVSWAF